MSIKQLAIHHAQIIVNTLGQFATLLLPWRSSNSTRNVIVN